jgi:hypothetical protein
METSTPFLEILSEPQQRLWPQLAPLAKLGFVLYGGTAMALRLGHRRSVDFDFFSSLPLSVETKALILALPGIDGAEVTQGVADTLSVCTGEGVKVACFGGMTLGRVGVPRMTRDGVLCVA